MIEFKLPSLGADMESATLVAWQKRPGDAVHRGELLAEVETDKGIIEIDSLADGVLDKIVIPLGEKVPVGTVLAHIREYQATPGESTATGAVAASLHPSSEPAKTHVPAAPPIPVISHGMAEPGRLPMSPSARRLARELGVDPSRVHGTGHGGAITREDILRVAAPAPAVPDVSGTKKAEQRDRMRKTIAAAMSRSKREVPHYYLSSTIDLQPAMNWLSEENLKRPMTERLLYGVLLLKATALALREVPELNSVWENEHVVQKSEIHVGVAISLRGGGLIAPAIHDTDRRSLDELMHSLLDLVTRARGGGLKSSELSDPTITLTNLGEQGVETVFGVIYPPQVAIVGFGKVVERPWSIQGGLMSRQVVTASLSADHRVSDGHRGGLFLAAIDRLLQEPDKL